MSTPDLHARIHSWVQAHRDEIVGALRSIVAIETINHPPEGNELKGQMAFAGMARVLGCEVDVYEINSVPGLLEHPRYWKERPCTGRPNVMAIRKGSGGGKSLLFSGHMDTIGVGPDPWQHDSFAGETEDGKMYGLGTYDMKGGVVASLMVVKALNDLGIQLQGDLMVESVVDEEAGGCNGTLAARLKYNADFAILSEPTNLVPCVAHLGCLLLRVAFKGKPGIGISKPIDPTRPLSRFNDLLYQWQAKRDKTAPLPETYRNNPALFILVTQMQAGNTDLIFMGDRVPSRAWLNVLLSSYPGETQDDILQDLQSFYREAQTHDEVLAQFEPTWEPVRWLDGSEISHDHPGALTFSKELRAVRGEAAEIKAAGFQCDAHMFNLHSSTPVLILGPNGGGAHAPDEHIVVEDYLKLVETFIRGACAWCGVASEDYQNH